MVAIIFQYHADIKVKYLVILSACKYQVKTSRAIMKGLFQNQGLPFFWTNQ